MKWRNDEGVSTVLGAILVAALMVMVLVMVRVNFVPQWDEQADAQQLSEIEDQLAVFRGVLDQQLQTPPDTPISVPIDLAAGDRGVGLFASPTLPSTLNFEGSTDGAMELSADSILIRKQTSVALAAVNEQWSDVFTNGTIEDVLEVSHLRLRLTDPESGDNGDGITLTIKDSNGQFAGSLRYYVEHIASSYATNAEVKNAAGTTIFDGGEAAHHQVSPTYSWLDAMDQSLFFNQVLAAADGPLTLELAQVGLTGDYAITYVQETPGGPVTVGNSGLQIDDYSTTLSAGSLNVAWRPARLPEQTLVYEHGAVFRVQDDGAGLFIPPAVSFVAAGPTTHFGMGLPMLTGEANSRTGGSVPIQIQATSSITIDGQANNFTIRLETIYPNLWRTAFENAATDGGVPESQYTLTTDATSVTLAIDGPSLDANTYDLSVGLRQASIATSFPT